MFCLAFRGEWNLYSCMVYVLEFQNFSLSVLKKMIIVPGIHKILMGIANMKDHEQTASDLGLCCLSQGN